MKTKIHMSHVAFRERRQARLCWWRTAFRTPRIADWAIFAKAKTLATAFISLLGLASSQGGRTPNANLEGRSSAIRCSKRSRRVKRGLRHEGLEGRVLLASDLYVDQPEDFVIVAGVQDSQPDVGDTVTWVGPDGEVDASSGGNDDVNGLSFGTEAFSSIQAAIDAAPANATIRIASGTYDESIVIDKPLTLIGVGQGATSINAGGASYGIHLVSGADGVTIRDLTISGANDYGIHTAGPSGIANLTIDSVTVTGTHNANGGFGGSGIDLNGVTGTNLVRNVAVIGNAGYGLSLPSASGVTIENLITATGTGSGQQNAWGGVGIFPSQQANTAPTGIVFTGTSTNIDVVTIQPGAATITASTSIGSDVQLPESFTDEVRYTRTTDSLYSRSYLAVGNGPTLAELVAPTSNDTVIVDNRNGHFIVTPSISIQDAIDASSPQNTINLLAGTFVENLVVNKAISIEGATGTGGVLESVLRPESGAAVTLTSLTGGFSLYLRQLKLDGTGGGESGVFVDDDPNPLSGGLVIRDSEISDFSQNGVAVFGLESPPTPSHLQVEIHDTNLNRNGSPSGASGDGDLLFFQHAGVVELVRVNITGKNSSTDAPAENAIQFRGDGAVLNHVVMNTVTIAGDYEKQPIAFFNYLDLTRLNATNVTITADSTDSGISGNFDGNGGDLTTAGFDYTGAPDPFAIQGDDASNTLTGNAGSDVFVGNAGDDILSGGASVDAAIYSGNRLGFTLAVSIDLFGFVTGISHVIDTNASDGDEGSDALTSVEVIQFTDVTLDLTSPVQLFNSSGKLIGTFDGVDVAAAEAAALATGEIGQTVRSLDNGTAEIKSIVDDGSGGKQFAALSYADNLENILDQAVSDTPAGETPRVVFQIPQESGMQVSAALQSFVDTLGNTDSTGDTSTIEVEVELQEGQAYSGLIIDLPNDVELIIKGGAATITGASPSLTVNGGVVTVIGNTITGATGSLTTATDHPTLLVTGGSLTVRSSIITESTGAGFDQPAIRVTGGTVDLGTTADNGNNEFVITGDGSLIDNQSPSPILAIGNTFKQDAVILTDNFAIESEITHAVDNGTGGLVTWVEGELFVANGGSIQNAINAASSGDVINIEAGTYTESLEVDGKEISLIAETNAIVIIDGQDIDSTNLELIGDAEVTIIGLVFQNATVFGITVEGTSELSLVRSEVLGGNVSGLFIDTSGDVSIEESRFTGNQVGILVDSSASGDITIRNSDLSGNISRAIQNASTNGSVVDASFNWWGSAVAATILASTTGSVDFSPFLDSGTDGDGGATGFDGDFSILNATALGAQVGGTRIQEAIDHAAMPTLVKVHDGTYNETVTINHPMTLQSLNEHGALLSPSSGTNQAIVTVQASNVNVMDFDFLLDQDHATAGVYMETVGDTYSNLTVENNQFRITGNPTIGGANGYVGFGTDSTAIAVRNTNDSTSAPTVTIINNQILPELSGSTVTAMYDRAIFLRAVNGTVSGNTISGDSHDLAAQFVGHGTLTISGNAFEGVGGKDTKGAQLDITEPNWHGNVIITDNSFNPYTNSVPSGSTHVRSLMIKNNRSGVPVVVDDNDFTVSEVGILIGNSNATTITNNTFTGLAGDSDFVHLQLSNKVATGGAPSPVEMNATIQGNTFGESTVSGGRGIEFLNHNSIGSTFGAITLGGEGAMANTFEGGLDQFVYLDGETQADSQSSTRPYYVQYGSTTMASFDVDLNVQENLFALGGASPVRAADLDPVVNLADLFALEDRIHHALDASGLGTVTISEGHQFVTAESGSIQRGVDAADTGDTVNVAAETFVEDVAVAKTVRLLGAGAESGGTTVSGEIGGSHATFHILASNVEIEGFTITREGNNPSEWNLALNSAGIAIQGQAIAGTSIHSNTLTGNRTAIDINNSNGHVISNNVIDNNHTGMLFRNQTDNLTVEQNAITNNRTTGILFLDASSGTNSPIQSAANSSFNNNNISGNWYGQIVDRQAGGTLPSPGNNVKDFSGNWFGTNDPVISTANSSEPGYAGLIPVAFGGEATPPGGQPDVLGPGVENFDISSYLDTGMDTNSGVFGFQGDFSSLHVTTDLSQTSGNGRLTEAVASLDDSSPEGGTLHIHAGEYTDDLDTTTKTITASPGSSPGQVVITGNVTLDGDDTLSIELDGSDPAAEYDNLVVNGTVSLGDAELDLSRGFAPLPGMSFTLINNDDTDAIIGTFAGISEGDVVMVSGLPMNVSYVGGTGNDLVLTITQPTEVWVNDTWQDLGNASGGIPGIVESGDVVEGGALDDETISGKIFGYNAFASIQQAIDVVADGGTVHVLAGIYDEVVTINDSITLESITPHQAVIAPTTGSQQSVISVNAPDVTIMGFSIQVNQDDDFSGAPIAPVGISAIPTGNTSIDFDNLSIKGNKITSIGDSPANWGDSPSLSVRAAGIVLYDGSAGNVPTVSIENNTVDILSGTSFFQRAIWLAQVEADVTGNTLSGAANDLLIQFASAGAGGDGISLIDGNDFLGQHRGGGGGLNISGPNNSATGVQVSNNTFAPTAGDPFNTQQSAVINQNPNAVPIEFTGNTFIGHVVGIAVGNAAGVSISGNLFTPTTEVDFNTLLPYSVRGVLGGNDYLHISVDSDAPSSGDSTILPIGVTIDNNTFNPSASPGAIGTAISVADNLAGSTFAANGVEIGVNTNNTYTAGLTRGIAVSGGVATISDNVTDALGAGVAVSGGTVNLASSDLSGNAIGIALSGTGELTVGLGNTITGGTTGLLFDGPDVGLTGLDLSDLSISGQSGNHIALAGNALDDEDLDGSGLTLGGVAVSAMTPLELATAGEQIFDEMDDLAVGLVRLGTTIAVMPTASPTAIDNDYLRIMRAVEAASDGNTIVLVANGADNVFNWDEVNALASWQLGNDGVGGNGDDWAAYLPVGLNNVTITADDTDNITIQGPGDIAAANLEGAFASSGENTGWTFENIDILNFDVAIGLYSFNGEHYNDLTIKNLDIQVAADDSGGSDANQNIGLYYSGGENITITNNRFVLDGAGGGTSFATQSTTHGGDRYDGLQITNNTISVANAGGERIFGVWENGHAHGSNITVSGNMFTGNAGNTNEQTAFRITSHSSASTTVEYNNNTISQVDVAFDWLDVYGGNPQDYAGTLPILMDGNTISGSGIAYDIGGISGSATITGGTVTGASGIGVNVAEDNSATVSGVTLQNLNSAIRVGGSANVSNVAFDNLNDNLVDIQLLPSATAITIGDGNSFGGNSYFIDNQSPLDIDLSTTTGTTFDETDNFRIEDKMFHALDDASSGLIRVVPGELFVTTPNTGLADETIQRAVDAADAGDLVNVESGSFVENVTINKDIDIVGDVADGTLVSPSSGSAFTVLGSGTFGTADDQVTFDHINLDGTSTASYGVRVEGDANVGTVSFANADISNFRQNGFNVSGSTLTSALVGQVDLSELTFGNNGISGGDGSGDIQFFGFNNDATLSNLTLVGNRDETAGTGARLGIQFRGVGDGDGLSEMPMGTVSLSNVDISGKYRTQMIGIQRYSDVDNLSFSNVVLGGAGSEITGGFGASLRFDGVGSGSVSTPATLDLGTTEFRGLDGTSAQQHEIEFSPDNDFAFLRVDGTNTVWSGISASALTLSEAFGVEDRILHFVDKLNPTHGGPHGPYKGFVDIQSNQSFITDAVDSGVVGDGSIQRGVDIVAAGGTVNVGPGTFVETVNVGKQVTIDGQGPANTILDADGNNGFELQADGIVVSDLRVTHADDAFEFSGSSDGASLTNVQADASGRGVHVQGTATNLTLDDVTLTGNTTGMRVATQGIASGLQILDSSFNGNEFGMTVYASSSLTDNETDFTDILVKDSSFSNNTTKGLYFEKLNNATLDNVTIDNSGTSGGFSSGIDINLKYGTYTKIDILGGSITNSGTSDAVNGSGLTIKARGTGNDPSYSSNPAVLTNVLVDGMTFDGNSHGVRIGEPGKDNTGPTGVLLDGVMINNSTGNGLDVVGGQVALQNSSVTSSSPNDRGVRVVGSAKVVVTDSVVTGSDVGVDVDGGTAMVEGTDVTGNAIGVLIKNSGVADLGDYLLDRDISGLGSSVGGNDFTGYTSSSTTSGAIVNLNTGGLDSNVGPQGAPPDVAALGNTFDPALTSPALVENAIFHDVDQSSLGFVQTQGNSRFSIDDVTIIEGDTGTQLATFTITRTDNLFDVSVHYTANGITADAGTDFSAASGTVSFIAGGAFSQTITIEVLSDETVELNETFAVNLSNPMGGTLADAQGIGTILNDDSAQLRIAGNITQSEGDSGFTLYTFTAELTQPVDVPILVLWDVFDGTGANPAMFADGDLITTGGSLGFAASQVSRTFRVLVVGDTVVEMDEDFLVSLGFVLPNGRDVSIAAPGDGGERFGFITNDDGVPVAQNDAFTVDEDSLLTGNVFANNGNGADADSDGDALTVVEVNEAPGAVGVPFSTSNGTVTLNTDGSFSYQGNKDYEGPDSFTYTITDGTTTDTATVNINVTPVNDAPVAHDLDLATNFDQPLPANSALTLTITDSPTLLTHLDILELATDVDDDLTSESFDFGGGSATATVTINGVPQSVLLSDLSLTYTPSDGKLVLDPTSSTVLAGLAQGEIAIVNVKFGVTDNDNGNGTPFDVGNIIFKVVGTNDQPDAIDDANLSTTEDTPLTINISWLLANDTDVDGDTLSITGVIASNNASAEIVGATIVVTPEPNNTGDITLTYTADDGSGAANATDTATVLIAVTAANDAPVLAAIGGQTVTELATLTLQLSASDIDGDTPAFSLVNEPAGMNINGSNELVWTPTEEQGPGDYTFTVVASDGNGGTDSEVITVTVTEANAAPVVGGSVTLPAIPEDSGAIIITAAKLLENSTDGDVPAQNLNVAMLSANSGTLVDLGGGVWSFTPDANFNGTVTFNYAVSDGVVTTAANDNATLEVTPVNDAPVAELFVAPATIFEDDSIYGVTLGGGGATDIPFAALGSDIEDVLDKDDFTFTGASVDGVMGSLAEAGISYTPASGLFELDPTAPTYQSLKAGEAINVIVNFTVTDSGALTDTGTANFTVVGINDPVEANDDVVNSSRNAVVSFQVLTNDTDADGDALEVTQVTPAGGSPQDVTTTPTVALANGTLHFTAPGLFNYTPNPGFVGTETFTYTVSDGATTDTAIVTINVSDGNSAPIANDDSFSISENAMLNGVNVFDNNGNGVDSDPDGDELTAVLLTQAVNGTALILADGNLTYTPATDFFGVDTFSYRVLDGNGGVATADVTVTVANVNDPPEIGDFSFSVDENSTSAVGVIGVVFGTDIDNAAMDLSYSISGPDAALFKIDPATGEITIGAGVASGDLNFELKSIYTFDVQVSDGALNGDGSVTINLADLAEAGPQVQAVRINSTAWSPIFRDFVDGGFSDAKARGYYLPTGSGQLDVVPWINVNEISIEFTHDVGASLGIDDFAFTGVAGLRPDLTTGRIPSVVSVMYDETSNTATLILSEALDVARYELRVQASGLSDSNGNILDGEWSNGISTVSGDGFSGGDFSYEINILPGDTNLDAIVDGSDQSEVSGSGVLFSGIGPLGSYTAYRDLNGDASLNNDDRIGVQNRVGSKFLN